MDLTLAAISRGGAYAKSSAGIPRAPEVDVQGNLIQAPALPERSLFSAQGKLWEGGLSTTTGTITAITGGMPTTQAQLALYNGETGANAKSYIIDRVYIMVITSSTAGGIAIITTGVIPSSSIVGTLATIFGGTAVPNANIKNTAGKGYYGGNAKLFTNGTITAVPAIAITDWIPVQSLPGAGAAATTLGSVVTGECYGRYILPPGAAIAFNVMGASAAGTNGIWVSWAEMDMTAA